MSEAENLPSIVRLVAVPLGRSDDLSPRARQSLEDSELLFCEDTRKTRELADRSGLKLRARLVALPGDKESIVSFDGFRGQGAAWGLVSDAGTPLVSDPGRALLAWARDRGVRVEAIPGPSAPVLAWQWSGGFGLPFVFAGFAPRLRSSYSADFARFFGLAETCGTFCFFDTRHRIVETLAVLADSDWSEAQLAIAREMTKPHEELLVGTVRELESIVRERLSKDRPFGEVTVLLEGRRREPGPASAPLSELVKLRAGTPKEAARVVARLSGVSVKDAYEALVEAAQRKDSQE